mmetsp:Transcript_8507/g.13946  ORF Transcript_8507/g.13946 Transcript_8507/m.13946 type:complete len:106 (-) Transcript_8507:349-666(-)
MGNAKSVCPNQHALTPFLTTHSKWYCSNCHQESGKKVYVGPKGTEMWGCRACDYDLCLECSTEGLNRAGALACVCVQPEPAPAPTPEPAAARRVSLKNLFGGSQK